MNTLIKVDDTRIDATDENRRVIKFLRYGANDVQTANEAPPFGIDSNPLKDWIAVYAQTDDKGSPVIIGYLNPNQLAGPGETRLFSLDPDTGDTKFYAWLRADGTMSLGGEADNLVRFSKLKEAFDELQNDMKSLKDAFNNWIVSPSDGGAALKVASATWAGTPLETTIDPAKIAEIKTL